MKVYETKDIRNIALVGGAKSGKTTLAEDMLFEGGVINRRGSVDDKNSVSDYRPIELERQNSVFSTILYTEFNGKKINIIDTPGFDDFVGEVTAAIKVVDTAVMIVNAQNGVEVGTEIAWRYTDKYNTPVVFAINHLEHENSNFDETIRQLKSQFGGSLSICQYPVNIGHGFDSVIDLLKMKMYKFPEDGGKPEITDIPEDEKAKAQEMQEAMIEDLASSDEELMEKFFENGTLSEDEMQQGLKVGLATRGLFPVFCIGAKYNWGANRLMEFIVNNAPAPNESAPVKTKEGKELKCNASEPTTAFVFKTSIESHLGEISFFKVYNGEVIEGSDLMNANTSTKERISQLFVMAGGMTLTDRDDWAERMRLFADKGWNRQPDWERRAYLLLGPNYRMTELQAAVGLAQLEKVADVVRRRNELGTLLSQVISDVVGIQPAPVTEGGSHSYWTYPLATGDWPAAEFGPALAAEGVPCRPGYIVDPIFLCMEALATKLTYGTSQCPFTCHWTERDIEYTEEMCPRTSAALSHMVTFTFNENYSEGDILDVAGAIKKVATELGDS